MQPDPREPADAQREHGRLVLQDAELALDHAALMVQALEPVGAAQDRRVQARRLYPH